MLDVDLFPDELYGRPINKHSAEDLYIFIQEFINLLHIFIWMQTTRSLDKSGVWHNTNYLPLSELSVS
jgi:hypothetical protein